MQAGDMVTLLASGRGLDGFQSCKACLNMNYDTLELAKLRSSRNEDEGIDRGLVKM
jgi:hypothetical protein